MKIKFLYILLGTALICAGCGHKNNPSSPVTTATETTVSQTPEIFANSYGVFLSLDDSDLTRFKDYETIVIDAQYFSTESLATLHAEGHAIYTYLNVGSIENFRDYYKDYKDICLGAYENWDEEEWIDVSQNKWQTHIFTLAKELADKGIDGYFIDNCDVYYNFPEEKIYDGLATILKALVTSGKEVIINGGDTFVTEYREKNNTAKDIMTGVNQENVFASIDFDNNTFGTAAPDDHEYFAEYVEACGKDGMKVFLLEYTKDSELIDKIKAYCEKNKFEYYISDSIELD